MAQEKDQKHSPKSIHELYQVAAQEKMTAAEQNSELREKIKLVEEALEAKKNECYFRQQPLRILELEATSEELDAARKKLEQAQQEYRAIQEKLNELQAKRIARKEALQHKRKIDAALLPRTRSRTALASYLEGFKDEKPLSTYGQVSATFMTNRVMAPSAEPWLSVLSPLQLPLKTIDKSSLFSTWPTRFNPFTPNPLGSLLDPKTPGTGFGPSLIELSSPSYKITCSPTKSEDNQ